MTVYIVIKNGKVDQVFENEKSAKNHVKNLIKGWSIAEIVVRETIPLV